MGVKSKIRLLTKISLPKFIWYNFFSKKVERQGKGFLKPYKHSSLDLEKGAKIILHDGNFIVNYYLPKHSKAEAYVRMSEGAKLEIFGRASLCYKATIEIKKDAAVTIGSAYINSGAVILAAKEINIGKEVLISREVFIYDSDHHPLLDDNGNQTNPPRSVTIGDHVWIGLKSTIIRGSKIGNGAIISAGSLVAGKIRPGTMAVGSPARSALEVKWRP